jgi:hypothetical protein
MPLKEFDFIMPGDLEEQAKTLDDKAKCQQGYTGSVPGQEGSLGGKQDSGIVQVRHNLTLIYFRQFCKKK